VKTATWNIHQKMKRKLNVTCDIFMKEVVIAKYNVEEKSKINPSLEFESGGN